VEAVSANPGPARGPKVPPVPGLPKGGAVRNRQERRYGRHTHAPRAPVQAASGVTEPGGIWRAGRGDRAGRTASGRLVLVVVDDRDAADSLALVLGVLGYRVEVAYGGAGAVEAAIEAIPDVAVLDLGMPGMDGYELARRLRARPRGEEVILVALTGWVGEPYRRRAREAGFDHFLAKPASLEALISALGGVVGPAGCALRPLAPRPSPQNRAAGAPDEAPRAEPGRY
jgi:CheY-like chemotaxis protein